MAVNKTVTLEAKTKGFDEAEKQIEDVAKATKVANDSVQGLNKTFEQTYGEIQPLTTRMGEAEDRLYELAAAGDTTSKEYQGLLNKVGEYRKVQIQTDLAVDQAAGTMSQKLGGALTGAASGFAAVQGVMALTGSESEALEESLLKVQGAMAFQQGVQGVLDFSKSIGLAGKATKVFNLIVKANPLALLATAIIGIIGYFAVFTDAIDVAIDGLKSVGDFLGITNFKEEELAEERRKRNVAQMERQKAEQTLRDAEIKQLEALGKSTIKLRRQQVEADLAALKSSQEFFDSQFKFLAEIQGKEFKRSATAIEKQAQIIALETQLIELDKEQESVNKSNSEKAQARRKKKKEDLEEERRLTQEIIDKEIEEEIALQQTFDAIQRENEDRFRTEQENELLLVEEKYDALEAMAFGNAEALEEIEIARLNERNDLLFKYDTEAYDAKKALDDQAQADKDAANAKELADAKLLQDAKFKMAQDGLALISNITQLFGQKNEKQAKRAFQIDKAAKIASATMSGIEGTINAYKTAQSSPITTLLPVYPVIQAGLAAAFAATNVAAIGQQKFEGGGPGPDVSAGGGGGGTQAPSFNVVGDSNVNQLAELQQQPAQAYVVSGEVTTAQALDRNRVQNATL